MAGRAAAAARPSARRPIVKVIVALAVIFAVGVTFWRTVVSARSAPYTLSPATQRPWRITMAATPPTEVTSPVLLLVPPTDLSRELFDQVFKRSMESMRAPEMMGMPLVLAGELQLSGGAGVPPEALVEMARAAGLEQSAPAPRCMGHRRAPEDSRQQAHFALFDSAAFATFRWNLATRLGSKFDAGAVAPVLWVGLVESSLPRWLSSAPPDAQKDCVAPIAIAAP
jgi:hypothetical protein